MALKPRTGNISALQPNWRSAVEVQYQFKTGIRTSYNGTEQREALRERARVEVSFDAMLREGAIHRLAADLTKDADALVVLPMFWRRAEIASVAGATVTLTSAPFWAVPGARLVLDGATQEAVTITSVAGAVVTLQSAPVGVFAAKDRVYPAMLARGDAQSEVRYSTDNVATAAVRFNLDPGTDPQAVQVIAPQTFDGRDMLTAEPNWSRAPALNFASGRVEFDPTRGRVATSNPLAFTPRLLKVGYTGFSAEDVEGLVAFFMRQKGRRGAFRMPTCCSPPTRG